jgi:hypothetical protein
MAKMYATIASDASQAKRRFHFWKTGVLLVWLENGKVLLSFQGFLRSLASSQTMKLPRAESAVIPRSKVKDYLLNLEHSIGGGKAKFFIHFGFRAEEWEKLADALRSHAQKNLIEDFFEDSDGVTYVIEGVIEAPSGRMPRVRTIWLLEAGALAPRFITAYPLKA